MAPEHRVIVLGQVGEWSAACDGVVGKGGTWPGKFRVSEQQGGVTEMTWSYRRPALRSLFEFADIDGDIGIVWLTIGSHDDAYRRGSSVGAAAADDEILW